MNTITKTRITQLNSAALRDLCIEVEESMDVHFRMPRKKHFTQVDLWRIRRNIKPVSVRTYLSAWSY